MSNALEAIKNKPVRQAKTVRELLVNEDAKSRLSEIAAKHLSPDRMMRVVAQAMNKSPELANCEPMTLLGALMECAAMGLEPNTALGHAYLIPFKNKRKGITEVNLIIGYKGLIDLARRSGHITSLSANIHYSDDELWDWEEGTEARLRHRPGPQKGKKLHAYAVASFKDGGHAFVALPWEVVMARRDQSQGWQSAVRYGKTESSVWFQHEDAMAKKTAIRALANYLPLSIEFVRAVEIDESRADFAGFAMNPDDGLTIDGDMVEPIEENDATDDDTKQIEKKTNNKKPEPEKKATDKPATKAAADGVQKKSSPTQKHLTTYDQIMADIGDGAPVEAALKFFAEKLSEMEKDAPDLHEQLLLEVSEETDESEESGDSRHD